MFSSVFTTYFSLYRALASIADFYAKMHRLILLISVALAHVTALRGAMQQTEVPASGFGVASYEDGHRLPSINTHPKTSRVGLSRGAATVLVHLALVAGLLFLIVRCFRALTSGRSVEVQGQTARRLAEEEQSCTVSHRAAKTASAAAVLVLCGSVFVDGIGRLNLRFRQSA